MAAAALAVTSIPAAALAAEPAPEHVPSPAAEQPGVREAARRGALLYAYDQAAWHGTDDMRAKLPDSESKIGGWIVDGPVEAPELVFFDKDEAAPHAVYVADFRDGKLVSSKVLGPGDDRSLSPERRSLIKALNMAMVALVASKVGRCSDSPMNSVVLPPLQAGAPTLVYFLEPQPDMNTVPFGGHFLVPVTADGKAGPVRRFTNTCIAMPLSTPGQPKPVVLLVTHLLDPIPTEIHVFSSLVAHIPVGVGTKDGRVWWVDGTDISLIQPKPD